MLKHFVIAAVRSLSRNRLYAVANILSLSLGLVGCLVVYQVVQFERSFDAYHNNPERIYRIVKQGLAFGETNYTSSVPYPMPGALRTEFPEFESITIIDAVLRSNVFAVRQEDGRMERFSEKSGVAYVEPDYFSIFKYTWLDGSPETAFNKPRSVVISESIAKKYFGSDDPMGKVILHDNTIPLTVSGLVKDVPLNTGLPFNMLIVFNAQERVDDDWNNYYGPVRCYVRLAPGVNAKEVEAKFSQFLRRYIREEDAAKSIFLLQPLEEVHFDSRFGGYARTMPEGLLWTLMSIAFALLVLASVNAVNLLSARAAGRVKELSVRRILGSSGFSFWMQSLTETALLVLVSLVITVALVNLVVSNIDLILGYSVGLFSVTDPYSVLFLIVLAVVITVAVGMVLFLRISRFPLQLQQRGNDLAKGSRYTLRRGLVIIQFFVSQVLLVSGIVVYEQSTYLTQADMGFNREALVEVALPVREEALLERLKMQLLQHPEIRGVSFTNTGTASSDDWGGDFTLNDGSQIIEKHAQIKFIDEDFLKTYGISLVAGTNISTSGGPARFLVNETFARVSGYGSNPNGLLGKKVKIWTHEALIGGIVSDFHTQSLRYVIEPVVFVPENTYRRAGIKISAVNISESIKAISREWAAIYPQNVFEYTFLDDTINSFYEHERRITRFVHVLTAAAVIIGSLGLFGLISFLVAWRRKEIGLRKVLGASVASIVGMLSKELLILVGIASVAAWPLAFWIMTSWLQNYAYRVEIYWWIFALSGSLAVVIALLTVGFQTVKAALANPVEVMRYE